MSQLAGCNEFKSPYRKLKRKVNTWCRYTSRLDTYGCGCQHGCEYCYAKALLEFRNKWNTKKPKVANISKIKSKIIRLPRNEVVRMGGMTDCFQPYEKIERVTYNTIIILNQFRISYLIVTKSSLVSDDLYLKIYDKKLAHFQVTITSTDDKKNIEIGASLPSERIRSVEKLYDLGFDISIRLSPFIEKYIDYEILNSIRCDKILIEFLKVNPAIRKSFNTDYSEYTHKYGGYNHLPLCRKIELVNKITGFNQVSVGEYVKDHYEYFRDNVNYNKQDCCNLNERTFEISKQLELFS
jgi:DNA repair photolyase